VPRDRTCNNHDPISFAIRLGTWKSQFGVCFVLVGLLVYFALFTRRDAQVSRHKDENPSGIYVSLVCWLEISVEFSWERHVE